MEMLGDADAHERRLLGAFRYTSNLAVLHRDDSLMPRRRRVWASWNFLGESGERVPKVCVSYWMNSLQPLATSTNYFVTLNPIRPVSEGSEVARFRYDHPQFDARAIAVQRELWSLQGHRNTWFCGSYFGYGFHEDALQSGLAVAEQLGGVRRPWTVAGESDRIHTASDTDVEPLREAAE